MPRPAKSSLDSIIQTSVQGVVARASQIIARLVAQKVAEGVEKQLSVASRGSRRKPARRGARRRRPGEITKWVADKRARRVPTFVIEMTGGLDTKKRIVAKFGENVVFEKGKPLPKLKAA